MTLEITKDKSNTAYRPILEYYKDGEEYRNNEIFDYIRNLLPPNERDEDLDAFIAYPIQHFRDAGCLEKIEDKPESEAWHRITKKGIKLLDSNLELSKSVVEKYCPKSIDGDSTFEEALETVKKILKRFGTNVDGNYDMMVIKQLEGADLIMPNKPKDFKGKTTQIAFTSEKRDIFPFLESFDYFYLNKEEYDHNMKTRFTLEVPVNLYSSNLQYLDVKNQLDFESDVFNEEQIKTTTTVVRNRKNKDWSYITLLRQLKNLEEENVVNDYNRRLKLLRQEVHLEISSDNSGEEFKDFRKLLYVDFYLIVLKHKSEFKYDIYGILPNDGEYILPKFELYSFPEKTITLLSPKLWTTDVNPNDIKDEGKNILLYGVPGCGKSYTIKDEYCDEESRIERVVFHPDYTYSDFIGQILPKVDEKDKVTYEFTAGPFTSILKKACDHPNKQFYLIIEEINRGNAPAIFGDVFQLLDRKTEDDDFPCGTSEYEISNPQIAHEIYKNKDNKVRIPSNLSIIATMNTADQNVFTLDTAFQRRWSMRLIPNKFKDDHEFADKPTILDTSVTWRQFVTYINDLILEKNTLVTSSEDKRLGVYFIQKEDLNEFKENGEKNNGFAEKVLKYLWDDAFKFSSNVFSDGCKSFEDVIDKFTSASGDDRFKAIFKNTDSLIVEDDGANGEN